jgi:hypothetical protein
MPKTKFLVVDSGGHDNDTDIGRVESPNLMRVKLKKDHTFIAPIIADTRFFLFFSLLSMPVVISPLRLVLNKCLVTK